MNIIVKAELNDTITINIVPKKPGGGLESLAVGADLPELAELESLKDEQELDFSACEGFKENFMGFKTPLPALRKQLIKNVATIIDKPKSYVLKYHHYSVIQHAVRKMPIVSAVNIDGDPKKRKDHTPRKDNWLRDNRIDLEVQMTNKLYSSSGFDKGHMSRREDANWGDTGAQARLSANLTCMHTNACPQVPELNRSTSSGLWGILEKLVLEKGAKDEEGKSAKICVYNGPIFDPNDRVLKGSDGIQVPVSFYKVIVWLNGKGEKKTTAFILSQEDLVDDGQFEILDFDKEEQFKEHQCSIAALEKLTGLVFTGIREWDTFKSRNKKDVSRLGKGELESLISENS